MTLRKIVFFIFFLSLTAVSIVAQSKNLLYKKVDSLVTTNNTHNCIKALNILNNVLLKDSINATYWIKHARASQACNKYKDAQISINKAILKDSTNALAYFNKGILFGNLNKLSVAKEAFRKAILLKPKNGLYHYYSAMTNLKLHALDNAEIDFKNAIKNGYETSALYNNYALLLLKKEDYNSALDITNKIINHDSNAPNAYATRALIHYFLLDFEQACSDKNTAFDLGFKNKDYLNIISTDFCNSSKTKQLELAAQSFLVNKNTSSFKLAIVCFNKLISTTSNATYFLDRGYAYFNLGDKKHATLDFDKALSLSNLHKNDYFENIISLYVDANDFNSALQYLEKQIQANRKNYKAYTAKSKIYFVLKNYNLAKKNALIAIAINPKYTEAHIVLGKAKYELGDMDFCTDFKKAKALGDTNAKALIDLYCN